MKIINYFIIIALVLQTIYIPKIDDVEASSSLMTIESYMGGYATSKSIPQKFLVDVLDDIVGVRTENNPYEDKMQFKPDSSISRQDAARMLVEAFYIEFQPSPTTPYADSAAIESDKTRGAINALYDMGINLGDESNNFNPGKHIKGKDFLKIAQRIIGTFTTTPYVTGNVEGNLVVNQPYATLENMTINGDLILAEGIADTKITLNNVTVTGNIVSRNQNRFELDFNGSTVNGEVIIAKDTYDYRKTYELVLDGQISYIDANTEISVDGTNVTGKFEVNSDAIVEHLKVGDQLITDFSHFNILTDSPIEVKYSGLSTFSAEGVNVYHVEPIVLPDGSVGVAGAGYYGEVIVFNAAGTKLWQSKKEDTSEFFIFELSTGNLDADAADEVVVVSADGFIYAFDDNGSKLWEYETLAPVYTATILDSKEVVAGGVDHYLYRINQDGQLVSRKMLPHKSDRTQVAVHLESEDLFGDGKEYIVAGTSGYSSGLNYLFVIDPANFEGEPMLEGNLKELQKGRFIGEMDVADIDGNGDKELIFTSARESKQTASVATYDVTPSSITSRYLGKQPEGFNDRDYRMGSITKVDVEGDEYLINVIGSSIVTYELDGTVRNLVTSDFSYTDGGYDDVNDILYIGSDQSGGDTIYAIDLKDPNWIESFKSIPALGRTQEVINNLITINNQIDHFTMPSYQVEANQSNENINIAMGVDSGIEYAKKHSPNGIISFSQLDKWSENYDRHAVLDSYWANNTDNRVDYNMSQSEIVAMARAHEERGEPFSLWVGHGTDPFYMQVETTKKFLKLRLIR